MTAGVYRAVMRLASAGATVASVVPGLPAHWRGVGDRLGRLAPDERAAASSASAMWIHAASVGELTAVRPLLTQLRTRFPGRLVVVSTTTRTGLALARDLPDVHLAFLLPLDAPGPVRSLLRAFRLDAFFFTETEIWPTLLTALAHERVPAIMVSGRISERTLARARWLRPLYRTALATVTCCMQTDEDAARIIALGADPRRVQVAGSLKFDAEAAEAPADVRTVGALLEGRKVVVAGSTHEGEETILVDVLTKLGLGHPGLVLLLAPRHPERFDPVAAAIAARGVPLVRWGALVAGTGAVPDAACVVLLDTVGVLAHCYALGQVAFVGGSLVPIGGHNVIEPARHSRPVLVGPYTQNAGPVVERLLAANGGMRVGTADQLALALDHLLAEPERAHDMGLRAWSAAQTGQGAVERHMKIIATVLESATFARAATG
jgi:3-deoxy-D-manno-octulosonic-acid transferase